MIRALLLMLLLPGAATAVAATDSEAPPWYDVEVVIFKNNAPPAGNEIWPVDPGSPEIAQAVELLPLPQGSPLPGDPQPFQQLDDASLALKPAAVRLSSSSAYKPLLHLAWRQPVSAQADAPAVHVATDAVEGETPALDGLVRVSRSRFLHIDVDLLYREAGDTDKAPPPSYRLQQTRRVNSGEVHYFDHPAFGLLVKLTPFEPPGQKGPRSPSR